MTEPGSPRHPEVGTVLYGYPIGAGASRYPIFMQVRRITKTGMLSCTILSVTKSNEKLVKRMCRSWDETPQVPKDAHKQRHGVHVMVEHKEAPLYCPSKRICLNVWDGKPKSACDDFCD